MSNAVGNVTMTSLELVEFINEDRRARAEVVGAAFPSPGFAKLEHADFMKKVPEVLGERAGNFSATYQIPGPNGSSRSAPCYRFPKREACLMAMSYSYELQAKVFDRMTALEFSQAHLLPNFADPVAAARAWADAKECEQQAVAELALAAPKVAFVDNYVQASTGSKGFRQVCKLLKANENEFRAFLTERDIMYKLAGEWTPHAPHIAAGRFETKAGVAEHGDTTHAYNQAKFTAKGVTWVACEWAKHKASVVKKGGAA
ncbi:phage antirepressor KilAC domain-containing protein [Comamonas sp. NoAH]|uniref:phage antirepressor KilAC domain-containing protein n=1 Tax=Comamonas halotolerans TaxID=3041496 RepID=UPI0024E17952|nr:phage antirepressor KilAC domain-containing protein [Comamonas sp. NoAH]